MRGSEDVFFWGPEAQAGAGVIVGGQGRTSKQRTSDKSETTANEGPSRVEVGARGGRDLHKNSHQRKRQWLSGLTKKSEGVRKQKKKAKGDRSQRLRWHREGGRAKPDGLKNPLGDNSMSRVGRVYEKKHKGTDGAEMPEQS